MAFFFVFTMDLTQIEKGWIMWHPATGSVWHDTFSATRAGCIRLALILWTDAGTIPAENRGWKPIRSIRIIIIHHKPL